MDEWRQHAACKDVDPELFFAERGADTRPAKRVCQTCVVRRPCLEFALENHEAFGVWGGLSYRERRRIRRNRISVAVLPSVRIVNPGPVAGALIIDLDGRRKAG